MNSREQFEAAYAEDNNVPVEFVALCRQGDSYNVPKVARAWYWWKRSRAAVVVDLPMVCASDDPFDLKRDIICELEAAGLKVAP